MGEFRYRAENQRGETVTGHFSADSESTVLRLLEEKGLFPISISTMGSQRAASANGLGRRVRTRDVGVMYGQLADLIGSGVPLLRALDSLVKSTVNPRLAAVLKEIRASVADGKSLTESMREHSDVFPVLHTAMIQAGERASFLEGVLRSLSDFLERLDELRSKVLGAMIYPALLTVVGCAVMIGALVFFVPRFEPLLSGTQQILPTRLLFAIGSYLYPSFNRTQKEYLQGARRSGRPSPFRSVTLYCRPRAMPSPGAAIVWRVKVKAARSQV